MPVPWCLGLTDLLTFIFYISTFFTSLVLSVEDQADFFYLRGKILSVVFEASVMGGSLVQLISNHTQLVANFKQRGPPCVVALFEAGCSVTGKSLIQLIKHHTKLVANFKQYGPPGVAALFEAGCFCKEGQWDCCCLCGDCVVGQL